MATSSDMLGIEWKRFTARLKAARTADGTPSPWKVLVGFSGDIEQLRLAFYAGADAAMRQCFNGTDPATRPQPSTTSIAKELIAFFD